MILQYTQVQFSANLISTASAVLFLLPRLPNFAKTHTLLGHGRLEVGCRDLIPPLGVHPVCRGACRGSGLCRVCVLPGAGVGVPDGGEPPGWGLCRGRPAGAGGGVPGQRPCRGRVVFPGWRHK